MPDNNQFLSHYVRLQEEVYIKCIKKPLGVDHVQIDTYPDSNKAIVVDDVTITHRKEDYSFLLELKLDLTDEDISELRDTEKFYQEGTLAYIIINKLDEAMKKVLSYIKYFSFVRELDENLHSQGFTQWSLGGQEWTDVPMKFEHKWVGGQFIYTLHKSFIDRIPELIKTGVVPFFGYFHLHKAFSETDTRHQWINATIAAELAIKEFLGTYKSDLLSILTH